MQGKSACDKQTFWRCLHDKCFTFVMHFLMIDLYHLYLVENTCLRLKSTGGFSHKVTGKPELDGKGSKLFFGSVSLQTKSFQNLFGTKPFSFSPISAELHENEYIGNQTREGKMVQFWNLSVQELYEVFEERVLPIGSTLGPLLGNLLGKFSG